jgi:lipoprotein-releasing system ATP-binding protein
MTELVVEAEGLGKHFGETEVLRDVGFFVARGERLCVWGPSGAGKSTLLHLVGLLTEPTVGRLRLFGKETSTMSEPERCALRNERIGFLFQFHHLLPDFTLLENVMIPLLIRRRPKAEAEEKSRGLLRRLGLASREGHRPSETSGGEQQRAALARALIGEPDVILADEPTGNLDRGIGREVEALLKEEVSARGAALVLVTHDDHLAAQMDRRLVLVDGRLEKT